MPDLNIRFEYLCAFVPPKSFEKSPTSCWVVLPDFTAAPSAHVPVLLYDRADRVDDAKLPPGVTAQEAGVKSPKPGNKWNSIRFRGTELELQPDGKPLSNKETLVTGPALDPTLRIARAGVGMEVFDKKLLTTQSSKVACRMFLKQGKLTVGQKTKSKFGVYDLEKAGKPLLHSQQMAQQLVYTIGFTKFVDIVFRKLDGSNERRLRLQPVAGPAVNVTIRNCEEELIWKDGFPPYNEQLNEEINLFFTLSASYKKSAPPHKIALQLSKDGANGICAPKTFDGWA